MLWGRYRNITEGRWAGLMTECEGEVGTLGLIHRNSLSLAPALDVRKVVLEGWELVLGSGLLARIQVLSEKVARREIVWPCDSFELSIKHNGMVWVL